MIIEKKRAKKKVREIAFFDVSVGSLLLGVQSSTMNTLSCELSQQLVKSLAMAIWVRESLAVTTDQPNYPARTAAHESAVVSADALVESLELMILLHESEHAAGGKGAVAKDLREFVDDVMAMVGARMPKRAHQ